MSLKAFSVEAFGDTIEIGIENALYTEQLLRGLPEWEIITPASLGILTFRFVAKNLNSANSIPTWPAK